MSKIALSSNTSGTGVFTIASLGTNTNQTLTLPNATGTLLSTADIATQAEAEAGTDNATVMTPLRAEDHMVANALGWGQTPKLVTYAASTWYQNTTGRPIYLNVRSSGTAGSHNFDYGTSTTVFGTYSVGDGSSGTWNTLSLVWQPNYFLRLGFTISSSAFSWEIS
jgi:hypothetical protein